MIRPAAEWAAEVSDHHVRLWWTKWVEKIQRDALQAAAEVCRAQMDVHMNETMDVLVGCGICADAVLAMISTADPGEITKEAET